MLAPLCVSAGFCATRTTNVWELLGKAGGPGQFERIREMIGNCPSGRLVLRGADGADGAAISGGPLWVRGGIEIVGTDGPPWEARNRVTLCRCGASKTKPFCDRSHEDIHFDEQ
ncbi:MAG: hypothetical protein EXR68_00135 [Dehalococcoidia bacterium]|nr:hypothetical protein [Dehalococcoidia bacterium]